MDSLNNFNNSDWSTWDESSSTCYEVKSEKYAIIDKETGNIIIDSPDLNAVMKKAYGQKAFWKLYMADYIQVILGSMDYKQLDVFMYISLNTQPSTNLFIGTYEKIMKDCNVSKDTVYKLIKKLINKNFIRRKQNGVYMVNPNIVMKGNNAKKSLLISYYDTEQFNKPLSGNRQKKD